MKTVSLTLVLAILAGCATGAQKTTESAPTSTTKPAPVAETSPAVTMTPVVSVEAKPAQPLGNVQSEQPHPAAVAKPETSWDDLARVVANWSGTMHKAMSNNCPQETAAKQ